MLILIVGFYCFGIGDDLKKMVENLKWLEVLFYVLFQVGYILMIGEWVVFFVWYVVGGVMIGDVFYEEIFYLVVYCLLQLCEGVLWLFGDFKGVDNDVWIVCECGILVWFDFKDVLGVSG